MRAAGLHVEDKVPRLRIHDDFAPLVVAAQEPPRRRAAVEARAEEGGLGVTARTLDDSDVVDEEFARSVQKTELERCMLGRVRERRLCSLMDGVLVPGGAEALVACRPRFAFRVVGARIAELQRGAAPVGKARPSPVLEVRDLIRRITAGVEKPDGVARIGKATGKIAENTRRRILGS